jgi:hypothetical protein
LHGLRADLGRGRGASCGQTRAISRSTDAGRFACHASTPSTSRRCRGPSGTIAPSTSTSTVPSNLIRTISNYHMAPWGAAYPANRRLPTGRVHRLGGLSQVQLDRAEILQGAGFAVLLAGRARAHDQVSFGLRPCVPWIFTKAGFGDDTLALSLDNCRGVDNSFDATARPYCGLAAGAPRLKYSTCRSCGSAKRCRAHEGRAVRASRRGCRAGPAGSGHRSRPTRWRIQAPIGSSDSGDSEA